MRSEQKEQTRQRMRQAAAEGFRSLGYGIGVDALAKRAGVTSGAFYAHFNSKAGAFREAVAHGMEDLLGGIRYFQQTHGPAWWPEFVRFYLGEKLTCDLVQSCSLQTLTPELARADDEAKDVFRTQLEAIAASIVEGPASPAKPATLADALTALASLIGAVTMARAMGDAELARTVSHAMRLRLLGDGA